MIVCVCDRCGKQCRTMTGPKILFKTTKEQATAEVSGDYFGSMDLCEECWNEFSDWYNFQLIKKLEEISVEVQPIEEAAQETVTEETLNIAIEQIIDEIVPEVIPEVEEIKIIEEEATKEEGDIIEEPKRKRSSKKK